MSMMSFRIFRSADLLGRTATLGVVVCAGSVWMQAQRVSASAPALEPALASTIDKPLDLANLAKADYSSSSSSMDTPLDMKTGRMSLGGIPSSSLQPPPRRRYGRPRYNDRMHNPDGSSKYAFVVGGGLTIPTGTTSQDFKTSYAFQGGAGRNFNQNLSLMAQFDYDKLGVTDQTLLNQETVYNYQAPAANQIANLGGNAHIWSLTLNPVYNIHTSEGLGAYIVGGVGFYHKVTNFTVPATGTGYDPYYGYYQYQADQVIDHYTSNAPGYNGGFGLTYKPSRFAGERLFAEVRYVYVMNQYRPGQSVANINNANTYNQFPANSNRTSYIPIKFGIRF